MSLYYGIPAEVLFQNNIEGTQLATFTAEASLLGGMNGMQPLIPGGFFGNPQQATSKVLALRATGILSSTATPTFTLFVRLNTSVGIITGASVGQTAAITTGSGVTNQPWELELDIVMMTPGFGSAAATVECSGLFTSPGVASPFMYLASPSANASAWTATIDGSVNQYISVSAACSASSASNKIQLKTLRVLGLN